MCRWLEAVCAIPRLALTQPSQCPQITNRSAIINGYVRTWLATDVIALFPCDTVGVLLSSYYQGGSFQRTIFVLNALRVRTPSRIPAPS